MSLRPQNIRLLELPIRVFVQVSNQADIRQINRLLHQEVEGFVNSLPERVEQFQLAEADLHYVKEIDTSAMPYNVYQVFENAWIEDMTP